MPQVKVTSLLYIKLEVLMQQPTNQSVDQRKDVPGQYLDTVLVPGQYLDITLVQAI